MVYLDTYQPLVVILLYTIRYVHSGIDKENDMEGLITDSQIETHEIPLKYDLFRERILPEFLQTVGEEGLAEYVDKVPEVVVTVDKRHTTIVYRHEHLYYTVPEELYRKLRHYKWKFRSRRRLTIPTREPGFTLSAEDLFELRNQMRVEVLNADNTTNTLVLTRNTQTLHPDDFPARRLHRYILDKYVSPKDMEDSALVRHELYPDNEESNSLVDLIHMKFPTVYRNIRRLNRTVTFIPFHLGSWRKPAQISFTTPYYMFSNYTLPTKKTHPTDIFDYDEPIHPRVTAEPIVLHDENKIQKRFSLAIVERIKQHHLRARTVDTSFLKYLVKPYKYSTTSLYSTVGTPASTTYFPGYHMYITTSPRTTTEAVSIEIKKVETINMNLNEDAFDMDMDFDYPDTNLATEAAKENKQEFYTTLSSHSKTLGISPKVESRQVNNFKEIQNVGNEKAIPTGNNTFNTQSSSSKGSSKEIEKTSKKNNIHNHLKKRDITAKPDKTRTVNKNSINAKKIQSTKMSNTTERTYLKLKNMLLKRLNKTITTKLIQLYTFKTRKIPITRKRNLIISTKCENPVKKTRAITNMNYILHGDKLGVTMKTTEKKKNLKIKINATRKKLKLKKVRSTQKTNNDKLADDNNSNIEYGNRSKDNKNHWTTLQFVSSTDNATKSQRKSKKTKAEVREELLHELYPPVTLSNEVYHDQEHRSEYKDCVKEPTQQYMDSNEKSDNPKKKRKKTKEEEFLNLMYPPVTLNEEWERAYENILIPTIPQNMSRDEYIRGFYTYGIEDVITTTAKSDYQSSQIQGYFQNDTELFSSQEKVKFKGVIELYNKYAKEFLQEAISTKRSRKKTTLLTTLKIIENSAEILPQHKHMKCLTRPYIHCNLSDFILNP